MRKLGSALAATGMAAAIAVGVSACGSDSSDSSGGSGKSGGSISIGTTGPDSYDPSLFQLVQAQQALHPVYTALTTYAAKEGKPGGEIVPAMAESLPKVSDGGKTYTYVMRKGLEYSDGTPAKASDFEHTMKRTIGLKGPYSSFFTGIAGSQKWQKNSDAKADIPGIATNDKTGAIVIRLDAPDAKFPFAMSMPYAAPVPASKAPIKDMTKNPPPGYGPYSIKVIDPSRSFVLTKRAGFKLTGVPSGKVTRINGKVIKNVDRMTQDVISGKLDFMTEDPTGNLLRQIRQKDKDRIREDPNPPNTYFFFLNVTQKPFNVLEARQAVNYAIDSRALARIFGGRLKPGCTVLPPAVEGYEKYHCPYGDPNGPPDLKKARELVEKSGTKGQQVTVWTDTKPPHDKIAQYYADALDSIGYRAKTKAVDNHFDLTGNRSTKAQTGFTNWLQDFPHPADFFQPLFSGDALESTPTTNQGFINDAEVNTKIQKLGEAPNLGDVAGRWGDLDEELVKDKAYLVPYGYEKATTFFSERMDFDGCAGVHPVWQNDWTRFCLK